LNVATLLTELQCTCVFVVYYCYYIIIIIIINPVLFYTG